jgi:hypothetical protein
MLCNDTHGQSERQHFRASNSVHVANKEIL